VPRRTATGNNSALTAKQHNQRAGRNIMYVDESPPKKTFGNNCTMAKGDYKTIYFLDESSRINILVKKCRFFDRF
jgi:hypothetical protein